MSDSRISFPVTQAKSDALAKRMSDCGLSEADIEEHFVRSSGPGGQNVNKTSTCVCLRHKTTGTEVKCTKSRSQALNRYYARKILCEMLENASMGKAAPAALKAAKIRKQKQRSRRRTKHRDDPSLDCE